MAKKSASQLKPVKAVPANNLPPIEETWENAWQSFKNTIDVNVELARRVDNLLNVRDLCFKILGEDYVWSLDSKERMNLYKWANDVSVATYMEIQRIIGTWELDEFLKEDMKDYFEDIMPKSDNVKDEMDLLFAAIKFLSIKPYGERMNQLHYTMLDEKKMREE